MRFGFTVSGLGFGVSGAGFESRIYESFGGISTLCVEALSGHHRKRLMLLSYPTATKLFSSTGGIEGFRSIPAGSGARLKCFALCTSNMLSPSTGS